MKKLLALVLALVMVLGLATIGANAAAEKTTFKDDADLEHKTAATVLNAIGVLTGDNNGNFNPKQPLTREQGIKIVIYMIEGDAANNLKAAAAPFSDVAADRWSAGVIAEAKALKIVDGNGDGTFSPEAPLTAAAFGKMLLVALGYEDRYEGFTGTDWTLNVARLVNASGLGNKIASIVWTGSISRDDAAQMAYNCLTCVMQQYTGELTADKNGNFGNKREDQHLDAYDYRSADDTGLMQFCEQYFPNLKRDEKGHDDFGNPVAYWYKGNTRLDYERTDAKTITAVSTADKVLTYTDAVKVKQIYSDLGLGKESKNIDAIFIDGAEFDPSVATEGGKIIVKDAKYVDGTFATLKGSDDTKVGGKGVLTTVSYNQDWNQPVVITMVTTFLAQANSDYSTKDKELKLSILNELVADKITTVSGDPVDDDYFETALNAKEDDYFWVTGIDKEGEDFEVKSLTPVTGTVKGAAVTAYKTDDTVTAGGTTYKYAIGAKRSTDNEFVDLVNGDYNMNNGATYDFILDPYGYVLFAEEHDSASNMNDFVVLKAYDVTPGMKVEAKLLFADGTTKTVKIAKVVDKAFNSTYKVDDNTYTINNDVIAYAADEATEAKFAAGEAKVLQTGRFYKYHENKNGEYELTFVYDEGVVDSAKYETQVLVADTTIKGNTTKPVATCGLVANTKSTLLANDKAYVGVKNWVDIEAVGGVVVLATKAENPVILGAYTPEKGTSTAAATDYYLLFNDPTTKVDSDGDTYYSYNAIKGGELVTLDVTSDNGNDLATGMYKVESWDGKLADELKPIDAKEDDNVGFLKLIEQAPNEEDAVTIKDGTMTVNGHAYLLASNVKFYDVDGRKDKDHAPDSTTTGAVKSLDYEAKTYKFFGMSTEDDDNTIDTLYVVRIG